MGGDWGGRRLHLRLVLVVTAGVMVAVLALGVATLVAFDRAVEPELSQRVQLIATILRSDLQQALDHGIPLGSIVGLEGHLEAVLGKFAEVDRIAILDSDGRVLAEVQRSLPVAPGMDWVGEVWTAPLVHTLPLLADGALVGEVRVDTNPLFVQTRLGEVFLDVLVLALVAVVLAVVLVHAVTVEAVGKPLRCALSLLGEQREGVFVHRVRPGGIGGLDRITRRLNDHAQDIAERLGTLPSDTRHALESRLEMRGAVIKPTLLRLADLNDIRLALFLFSVATEVSTAFMPIYARSLARPEWLSGELAASSPLLVYLLGVVIASPFAGAMAARFGARRLFLAAVAPTLVALLGMAISEDVLALTAWRLLLAVCYALATIACQEYALRAVPQSSGAEAVGVSMAVIFGGVFCGSALGGLLAERFGFAAAFVSGAAILATAGVTGWLMMSGTAGDPDPSPVGCNDAPPVLVMLCLRPRLALLLFAVAMPVNLTTATVVWFLTPMSLADQGGGPALIARVVMLYYLATVMVGSVVSRLADGRLGPGKPIILGSCLSIAALVMMTVWQLPAALAVAMGLLGLGHALMRGPLHGEVRKLSVGTPRVLDILRLIERLGALVGLLLCALWLERLGVRDSLLLVVVAVAPGVILYTAGSARQGRLGKKGG